MHTDGQDDLSYHWLAQKLPALKGSTPLVETRGAEKWQTPEDKTHRIGVRDETEMKLPPHRTGFHGGILQSKKLTEVSGF